MVKQQMTNVNYAGCDVTPTRNAMSSQRGVALSDGSGKRRPPLGLNSRWVNYLLFILYNSK